MNQLYCATDIINMNSDRERYSYNSIVCPKSLRNEDRLIAENDVEQRFLRRKRELKLILRNAISKRSPRSLQYNHFDIYLTMTKQSLNASK